VTVVPVIVKRSAATQAGAELFQAAGWIEPRPTSVNVAALAPGVIEELLVVEGQQVDRGEPIARLIQIDAELAVAQARAALAIRDGDLQRARAEYAAAMIRLDKPVHLKAQLADAQSLLAKANTELNKLPFLIAAAEANLAYTQASKDGKQASSAAIAGVIISRAVKDHAAARAELEELQQRGPNLQREQQALQAKVDAIEEQLSLLIEERRQVEEAAAKVASATALRDEAEILLQQAQLKLDRTIVRAPMTGRILRLVASPGARVMGLSHTARQDSSTVVEMYDPARLQVRADVRLEDVPLVTPGAPVVIETASSGNSITGRVLQSTSTANIQKNTLEVKVELIDPPPSVSPEMLVTATFLAPEREAASVAETDSERTFVPEQFLISEGRTTAVWIVDANQQAVFKTVVAGAGTGDGLVEITAGLNATDKLIASGSADLSPGDLVVISGEDQSIGVAR
jgi:HlyD family secretion protein